MAEMKKNDFVKGLSKKELISLDACMKCSECLKWCPVQDVTGDPSISPPQRIEMYKGFVEKTEGFLSKLLGRPGVKEEEMKRFQDALWKCSLCGSCGEVCEAGIDTKKLWWSLRRKMAETEVGIPEAIKGGVVNYEKFHSPFPKPLTRRYDIWLCDDISVAPQAEVGFYEGCGCVWDAPPMAEGAARLIAAGGPFTLLDAEDSWCCGFPQVAGAGAWSILPELANHMVKAIQAKGIRRLAISCPMCLDIMRYLYPRFLGEELPFECIMVSELIAQFVEEGRIKFTKGREETVTYHDPCAMARPFMGAPILEPPRRLIRALPGVKLVEMERNREMTRCCGGSAGTRGANSALAVKMGKELLLQAKRSGADTLLLNCPACYTTLAARTHMTPNADVDEWKRYEDPLKINDIAQYVAAFL